ncbi:MAG: AAA family ATPase [Desulfobacterales bacterium]|jgi:general secretion pathway protein A
MYEKHYKLKENPFQIEPDPKYLYLSPKHENALAYLRYGLIQKAAFTLLTGEIGTGKTTVGLYFLNQYCKAIKTALVSNTNVTPEQLLNLILKNFNIYPHGSDKTQNLELLQLFLIENYIKKIPSLLIIDEAQNLSEESLEEIRMLSNFQKDGKLLLQIMLVGQPELRSLLKRPNLANITQKISANYHLTALSAVETRKYIDYRFKKAGGDPQIFSREAMNLIYENSAGIPRIINLLCDAVLIYGFAEKLQFIDRQTVENAIEDKEGPGANFSSEYADSILSAPMLKKEDEDEGRKESGEETRDDLLNRIKAVEEDLNNLQKQVKISNKEFESSLNYLNALFKKKIKKILILERRRTRQLLKQYFQMLYKRLSPDKVSLENKERKIVSIKRKQDSDI